MPGARKAVDGPPRVKNAPALIAIRTASAKGSPIGGTSAGAAIMSSAMLLQGDSISALTGSREGEPIKVGEGHSFFS